MSLRSILASLTRVTFISERVSALREDAREQLRRVKVASESPALVLDGATAEVVTESENSGQNEGTVEWYYLTQVVRNQSGEYFLLKTTDASPFIKHLTQSRARIVLKSKYRAPCTHASQGDA